jgi:reactive intermediate/imine deaminase
MLLFARQKMASLFRGKAATGVDEAWLRGPHRRTGTIAHMTTTSRSIIRTDRAPRAIGPYSQAVRAGSTAYLSGQIPLDPATGELVAGDITAQTRRVFENLRAVCEAAGGSLAKLVRVGIYLTDLSHFAAVNAVMAEYCQEPYPARSTIGVAALPRGAQVEIDAVLVLD